MKKLLYPSLPIIFLIACSSGSVSEKADQIPNKDTAKKPLNKETPITSAKNQHSMKDSIHPEPLTLENYRSEALQDLKKKLSSGNSLKILCFGNSITHGYKTGSFGTVKNPYPQVLEKLLRDEFKNPNVQVINEGHNGWRSDQALANLRTLVLAQKPDWVILKLGINDAYSSFSPKYYLQNIRKMVEMMQAESIRIILMNPSPILTPFNTKVLEYSPLLRSLAEEKHCAFLNLYQGILKKKESSALFWTEVLPDDVHFADEQYRWIAEIVLDFIKDR